MQEIRTEIDELPQLKKLLFEVKPAIIIKAIMKLSTEERDKELKTMPEIEKMMMKNPAKYMMLSEVKHQEAVNGVHLSADGQLLATASLDMTARLFLYFGILSKKMWLRKSNEFVNEEEYKNPKWIKVLWLYGN